jgi:hypothetical protein
MSVKQVSIGQVMMVIALAALNLALIRATPFEIVTFPTIWVLLGTLDFVIFWKLVARRSMGGFHYTFLIVSVISYLILALVVSTERLSLLGPVIHWYQGIAGTNTQRNSVGYLWIAEFWTAWFVSLVLACAMGSLASWLERRRGWDIAAAFRGALIAFGGFMLLMLIVDWATGWGQPSAAQLIGRWVIMAIFLILGGWLGVTRLKSKWPDLKGRPG